jgi:hypothetical protein
LVIRHPPGLQTVPCVSLPQIAPFERDSAVFEGKPIHFPSRRNVRTSNGTGRFEPVHKIEHRSRLSRGRVDDLLKDEAGRGLTGSNGHLDFLAAGRLGRRGVAKTLRPGQAVTLLQLLRQGDGLFRLELAMPDRTIEADPAPDDMHMVKIGVVMPDHHILVIRKPHPRHEIGGNLRPSV